MANFHLEYILFEKIKKRKRNIVRSAKRLIVKYGFKSRERYSEEIKYGAGKRFNS